MTKSERDEIVDWLDAKIKKYTIFECMPENEDGYEYVPRESVVKIVDALIPMVKGKFKQKKAAKELEQLPTIASVSGKRPDCNCIDGSLLLHDLFQVANISNEDGMRVIEYINKPNGGRVAYIRYDAMVKKLNSIKAACASGAVDTVAEGEDREVIVNVKPTAEYKMTISKIEKITREAPSGGQP